MVETRINVPGFSLNKDSWGDVPDDATMAAKYFLDIMNDGTPEMRDGVREILKAIWMRLAMPDNVERSSEELWEAIYDWYRKVAREPMPVGTKVVTRS